MNSSTSHHTHQKDGQRQIKSTNVLAKIDETIESELVLSAAGRSKMVLDSSSTI